MRERMKFVVPLTIPSTRCTFETTSDSRSTFTTGIAAQTRCLEPQLHAGLRRDREQVGALAGDELLVRGHDRLAGAEQLADVSACRIEPAHHLRDDAIDGSSRTAAKSVVRTPSVGRERPLLVRVANEGADDPQPVAGRPLDLVGALDEQAVDRGADGAVPEKGDADVN